MNTKKHRLKSFVIFLILFLSLSPLFQNCAPGFQAQEQNIDLSSQLLGGDTLPTTTVNSTTTTTTLPSGQTSNSSTTSSTTTTTSSTSIPNVALVPCSSTQYEFPLSTHWSNSAQGFLEGATDAPIVNNPDPVSNRMIYNYGWLPRADNYIGNKFEIYQISNSEFQSWSQSICAQRGIAVELRRPSSFSDWNVARTEVVEARGSIQILHALIVDNNLVTIYLPPNWKRSDPRGKYPILFNGFYDLKTGVFSEGTLIAQTMATAWKDSGIPFIGVSWNGGGAIGSRTVNPNARASFNKIIQKIADSFGGDSQRIMMFGGSRGGMTALAMASNPEKYPYRVVAAYAASPAVDMNDAGSLTGSTIPALLNAAEWSIGYLDTWKKSFRYPANGLGMDGFTRTEAHLFILTGSRSASDMDSRLSLKSPWMLQGLKDAGTQVFFETGSHDFICPWVDQFRFYKQMENYGIPVETRVNYLSGHQTSGAVTTPENFARIMTQIYRNSFAGIFQAGRRSYFRNDASSGGFIATGSERFTFEIPRYETPNVDGQIIMTGVPGTQVEYGGQANGVDYPTHSVTLPADGTAISDLSTLTPGKYTVTFIRIKKPGDLNWKNLDLSKASTSYNSGSLVLDVLDYDMPADWSAAAIGLKILDGYLGPSREYTINGHENVSYGVVEGD